GLGRGHRQGDGGSHSGRARGESLQRFAQPGRQAAGGRVRSSHGEHLARHDQDLVPGAAGRTLADATPCPVPPPRRKSAKGPGLPITYTRGACLSRPPPSTILRPAPRRGQESTVSSARRLRIAALAALCLALPLGPAQAEIIVDPKAPMRWGELVGCELVVSAKYKAHQGRKLSLEVVRVLRGKGARPGDGLTVALRHESS